jgi:tetratricopeptide (TPR) repeat protein
MKVFNARIRTAGEPEEPGEITYVTEKNKFEDAARKFAAVADQYGRTLPGTEARYYAGLSYERLGQYGEAEKWLRQVASGSSEVGALGKFQLAGVLSEQGKNDEAVKLYQQLMDKPTLFAPKPVVMLALAEHYSKINPPEAAKLYNQVKAEYPDTPMAEEADKQLEHLQPKT